MKQLLIRFYHWLGRLLGEFDAPRYRRETDGLPRGGRPATGDTRPPPRPHLRMRTPPHKVHNRPEDAPAERASSDTPPAPTSQPGGPPEMPSSDLHSGEAPRYALSRSVLTPPEQRFYISLLRAVDNQYSILAKVRLGDVVWLVNNPPDRKRHQSRVWCKHVDFLLCERVSLKPRLAIELDDSTHRFPDHAARDQFKNDLFAAVGLRLLRIELQGSYRADDLHDRIAVALSTQDSHSSTTDN